MRYYQVLLGKYRDIWFKLMIIGHRTFFKMFFSRTFLKRGIIKVYLHHDVGKHIIRLKELKKYGDRAWQTDSIPYFSK